MNSYDVVSWAVGPAYFKRQDDEQIYVIPTWSDKSLKVVLENESPDATVIEARGGPGNNVFLKWKYDDVFVPGGISYCRCPSTPQIDTSAVEELL